MTTARSQQICVGATPYYHCVSRCVRRSFLCGEDPTTQRSYERRREWIKQKIYVLSQIYRIDICAYAITIDIKFQRYQLREYIVSSCGIKAMILVVLVQG